VYLAGLELRQQGANTVATRYYGGVAVRTTAGGLTWLASDQHGTGTLAIDAATLAATRRRLDPYGNPRTTNSIAWPGNRGFVDGTLDNTGLTHLGAREYEPSTGRFISDDPVIDPTDPQQINGYVYAAANPVTMSDPNGERTCSGAEDCAGVSGNSNSSASQPTQSAKPKPIAPRKSKAKSRPGWIAKAVKKATRSTARAIVKAVRDSAKKAAAQPGTAGLAAAEPDGTAGLEARPINSVTGNASGGTGDDSASDGSCGILTCPLFYYGPKAPVPEDTEFLWFIDTVGKFAAFGAFVGGVIGFFVGCATTILIGCFEGGIPAAGTGIVVGGAVGGAFGMGYATRRILEQHGVQWRWCWPIC
jgi:RHS repeat-associated protein